VPKRQESGQREPAIPSAPDATDSGVLRLDDGRALPPLWTLHRNLCFAVGAALREFNAVASVSIRNSLAFFPSGCSRSECIST
jgi:hypothetical protein